MKKSEKETQILDESDFDGPMMNGKAITKSEAKAISEWVKNHKAATKAKSPKSSFEKLPS